MSEFPPILAQEDGYGWIVQILLVVFLLLLSGIGTAIQKIRERMEQRRAREREMFRQQHGESRPPRPPQPPQQPRPARTPYEARQAQSVEEVVRAMRQAAAEKARAQTARQQPSPQPGRRTATPPPTPAPTQAARREAALSRIKAMDNEIASARARLHKMEAQRDRQLAGLSSVAGLIAAELRKLPAVQSDEISLDVAEARRGIIYSEILGPPLSLRPQSAMWELD